MENKKSFVLYSDASDTVNKLSDEDAGKLFKLILAHSNGETAVADSLLLDIAFGPIQAQMDRDEKKWQETRKSRSEAGKLGGRPKKQSKAKKAIGSFDKQSKAKKAVTGNGNGNGNVTDNGNGNEDTEVMPHSANTEDVYVTKSKRKLKGKRLETFEQFWKAFAYKKDRACAADSWLNIPTLTDSLVATIINAAAREASERPKMLENNRTPMFAQGWLTARRWEDEDSAIPSSQQKLTEPKKW